MGAGAVASPLLAAVAVGLSCGTGCSPTINMFIATYTMGNFNSFKKAIVGFLHFFLGKMTAVIGLAVLSSVLGSSIINKSGRIYGFDTTFVLDVSLILMGSFILIKSFLDRKREQGCSVCDKSCSREKSKLMKKGRMPIFLIGAAYGITPCAPLVMILVLVSSMNPARAVFYSGIFGAASMVSPLVLLAVFAGLLSSKMHKDIPQYIDAFKIVSCVLFVVIGAVSLGYHILK